MKVSDKRRKASKCAFATFVVISKCFSHPGIQSESTKKGLVSKETMGLRRWGSETQKFGFNN